MASLNPFVHPKDLRRRAQGEVLVHQIRRPHYWRSHGIPFAVRSALLQEWIYADDPILPKVHSPTMLPPLSRVTVWCDRGFFHYDPSCPASSVAPILLPLWDSSWIWYIIITYEEEKGFIVSGKVCGGRLGLRPRQLSLAPVPCG
ncbi:uncharacterized protein LOC119268446 isoform X5 [Triticum dicoccoides]|uniref:uncharacterized protein LOC119268446 isoform X5 n=1 Tax=Triticum dicoccoides TaxID=85692 RepID=UPI00188E8D3F|nr:uncharacterized protein LOC119268446 isoform X5 [Triticum dicoccoides]XP_037405987.1 uncharacterized protein LOC119268446 isoform X5 [Triticum dicoccoides]XP_037405988.1 uncharacterized protein LOC119268446 isoform X5 [Triticum dicoccoides]XP_037405989.1 uncharacterized protein LOC119268446 isoform X5 [Triticum dicoccoides]XP_037405990.1 uncharacterized protein LOC119268446 isoform X5 [Triticum dicoccoides]